MAQVPVVRLDGVSLPVQLGPQEHLLLAYLLLHPAPVTRETLADVLWAGAAPASWQGSLRVVVSKVRAALRLQVPDATIAFAAGAYHLVLPAGVEVDVRRAARLLDEGVVTGDHADEMIEEVLDITARPLLPGLEADWLQTARRQLCDLRYHALVARSSRQSSRGDGGAALRSAAEAVALDPLEESGHRALMRAHLARDEPAQALRVYERLRKRLAEELGTDPSRASQQVHMESLRGRDAARADRRADLLVQAHARAAQGQRVGAERLYLEVVGSARADGDVRALAEAAMGFAGPRGSLGRTDPAAVALLDEALGVVEPVEEALAAAVRSRLAVARMWDDLEAADAEIARALAVARRLRQPALRAQILDHRLFVDSVRRDTEAAAMAATADELSALAEQLGGGPKAEALGWKAVPLLDTGRLDDLDPLLERFTAAADAEGDARLRWWAVLMRGVVAAMRGALDRAEALGEMALDVGLSGEDRNVAAVHSAFIAGVHRERGSNESLRTSQRRAEEAMGAHPYVVCRRVWVDALTGHSGAARHQLRSAVAQAVPALPATSAWLPALVFLAHSATVLGDADSAATLEGHLAPYEDRRAFSLSRADHLGLVGHHLGQLALARGQPELAAERLRRALLREEASGALVRVVHTRRALANALRISGEMEEAQDLAGGARTLARRLRLG